MKNLLIPITMAVLLAGCGNDHLYTLYRNSPKELELNRVHVATFDAYSEEKYNQDNCQRAAKLFQSQQGVSVEYWCERGRYKK